MAWRNGFNKTESMEEDKENQPNKEEQKQQRPRPNQLSPQQIENLLEAMENEEKKVQEKMFVRIKALQITIQHQ